jgi:ketol-acid reductoisomerase
MKSKPKIAIIGYGSQGRAWAQNLKDSGCDITIGLATSSKSRRLAKKDGIENITTISRVVRNSDIIIFAFPDHVHGNTFKRDVEPFLKKNSALIFLHGFSIHFKTIISPSDCDIILLAPLGPGVAVREKYLEKKSISFFYGIEQNANKNAQQKLDYLIESLRIDKNAMIKTTFADEAIGDLFGEQAVLCGGLTQLIKYGFETLVESGLSPDKAYLEIGYQLDLIIDLIKNHGIEGMYDRISFTARYGSYKNGPKIIDKDVKKKMKETLRQIKKGEFARNINSLSISDQKSLRDRLKKLSHPKLEKSARKFAPKNKK